MSYCWFLDKSNGKDGTEAVRIVHGLLSLAKLILGVIFDEASPQIPLTPPHNVYHVRARRREEAVLIQLVNGIRLQRAGISYIRNVRDTYNAYPSVTHDSALTPSMASPKATYTTPLPTTYIRTFFALRQQTIQLFLGQTKGFSQGQRWAQRISIWQHGQHRPHGAAIGKQQGWQHI
jgi:hypothetical protein